MDYVAAADVSSGDVVVAGSRVGVALTDIASGASGSAQTTGVFSVPKASADDIAQGVEVYWDATAGDATLTSSANTLMGYAFVAAGAGVITLDVKLNG
jgi:predicted RecA/RadA family phage recombinase